MSPALTDAGRRLLAEAVVTERERLMDVRRIADALHASMTCQTGPLRDRCEVCQTCLDYTGAVRREVEAQLRLNAAERAFAAWQPRQERLDFGR